MPGTELQGVPSKSRPCFDPVLPRYPYIPPLWSGTIYSVSFSRVFFCRFTYAQMKQHVRLRTFFPVSLVLALVALTPAVRLYGGCVVPRGN